MKALYMKLLNMVIILITDWLNNKSTCHMLMTKPCKIMGRQCAFLLYLLPTKFFLSLLFLQSLHGKHIYVVLHC